jgi:hypothetical protein
VTTEARPTQTSQTLYTPAGLANHPSGRMAVSTTSRHCRRRLTHTLSYQLRLTPSQVGVGVANLALPVTSGSALCVRAPHGKGAEKKRWRR